MKKYLINRLKTADFDLIITLLDYETRISDFLKNIKISSPKKMRILIDTALCSGLNEYRFIAVSKKDDGSIDTQNYRYIAVSPELLNKANRILKKESKSLVNSILTEPQKCAILHM